MVKRVMFQCSPTVRHHSCLKVQTIKINFKRLGHYDQGVLNMSLVRSSGRMRRPLIPIFKFSKCPFFLNIDSFFDQKKRPFFEITLFFIFF